MNIPSRLAALAVAGVAAALLSACGGGDPPSPMASAPAMPLPAAARAAPAQCNTAALADGSYQLVGTECVRSSNVLGPQRAVAQPQRAGVATLTATQAMDWAETSYPLLFPLASRSADRMEGPYVYRYYASTNNYLGVSTGLSDVAVYLHGNVSGGQLTRVGALSDFTCRILACEVPGAPTITAATGGNGSITLTVAAPATGIAITGYSATCSANSALLASATSATTSLVVSGVANGTQYSCSVTASNAVGTGAASSAVNVTPQAPATGTSSTATSFCGTSSSVLNTTLNRTSTVATTCTSAQRTMTGNGIPDHAPGTFPNANNPNTISAQAYTFTTTLTPTVASAATAVSHVIGYASNSVPFDPATAESYQNAGVWRIEAIQSYLNLGLDSSNAHVQPTGAYHYHGMPEGYLARLARGTAMTLIGYAVDGFPVYARYGYASATDAASAVRTIVSSYRMKATADSGRPATTLVPMGTFTQDYEYVAGSGDLDECNGRFGVTPEFPNGIYHYYVTDTWPYIQRCVKGTYTAPTGGTGGTGLPPRPR